MLVSYWLFRAYSLKTEAKDGTVTCKIKKIIKKNECPDAPKKKKNLDITKSLA